MKKFVSLIVVVCLLCLAASAWAVPAAPVMSYEVDGVHISISWTEVPSATGYTLYYAPYPYTGPDTIGSFPMGTATSYSTRLWDGAAYFIAVTAANNSGESQYSNIEYFVMTPSTPDAPVLSYETAGLGISLSWTATSDAIGYKLHYASDVAPETFYSLDMGNETGAYYYLWEGAAYYLKVTSYTSSGLESEPSNTEYFIMGPPSPEWVDNDSDGFTEINGDCDDAAALISPNSEEICGDSIDQNCDGYDETCPVGTNDTDDDDDGYTENQGDCDDTDAGISPVATETCGDSLDQDCSGADEVCPVDPADVDDDNDGFTENQGDCNDAEITINPDATDTCDDEIDQDCSGADEVCPVGPNDVDNDGDGYTENQGDCNDGNNSINPNATEICGDGIDQNCSGADEGCPVTPTSLTITGGMQVNEGGTLQLTAAVTWSNNTTTNETLTALWSENEAAITTVVSGLVSAALVVEDTPATIAASFTAEGVTVGDSHAIVVKDVPTPSSLTITGNTDVNEGGTLQLTAAVTWSNNTVTDETAYATWGESSAAVSSAVIGLVTAGLVGADTAATITAAFSFNGIDVNDTHEINILDVRFVDNGDGTVTDTSTGLIWLQNANPYGERRTLGDIETIVHLLGNVYPGVWRVPNKDELLSIVDTSRSNPALPARHPFYNVQTDIPYFSSTHLNGMEVYVVSMGTGGVSSADVRSSLYSWPVRSGP